MELIDKATLMQKLYEHLGFDWKDGTYIYVLTRVKEAFSYGTMGLDDFVEIDDDFVSELADFILSLPKANGANESTQAKPEAVQCSCCMGTGIEVLKVKGDDTE